MTQVTEAIYSQGVLKPLDHLDLPEQQRVRLIVQPLDDSQVLNRADAVERLREGIQTMNFRSRGPLPSRSELHDRD